MHLLRAAASSAARAKAPVGPRPPLSPVKPASNFDPEKWELELRLRDARNRMLREYLSSGRSVFYKSSGSSMWPMVQSDDACTFHPIQAVTVHPIQAVTADGGPLDPEGGLRDRRRGRRLLPSAAQPAVLRPHSPQRRAVLLPAGAEVLDREHPGAATAAGASGSTSSASSLWSSLGGRGSTTGARSPERSSRRCSPW